MGKAAPAVDPRKIGTGRPRVTVLANYVAAPFSGLVGTGGSKAKAKRPRGGRSTHPVLKATVPRSEIAAVECRKATRSPVRERALPSSRPPRLGVMLHVPERRLAEIKRKQGGA